MLSALISDQSRRNRAAKIERKLPLYEFAIAFFGLLGMAFAIIENEIYLDDLLYYDESFDTNGLVFSYTVKLRDINESPFCSFLRVLVTISTSITVFRYRMLLVYYQKTSKVDAKDTLKSTGMWKTLALECSYLSIHLPVRANANFEGTDVGAYLSYSFDSIIVIVMMGRVYLLLRVFGHVSMWSNRKGQAIMRENDIFGVQYVFSLKAELKTRPYRIILFVLVITVILFGFALRLSEITYMHESRLNWNYHWEGMWCILVTITTVGYGDLYPRTSFGRLITVGACLWGTFLISLMIVALTNSSSLTLSEVKAFSRVRNSERMLKITNQAADSIKSAIRLYIAIKQYRIEKAEYILLQREQIKVHGKVQTRKSLASLVSAKLLFRARRRFNIRIMNFKNYKVLYAPHEGTENVNSLFSHIEARLELGKEALLSKTHIFLNIMVDMYLADSFQEQLIERIDKIHAIYTDLYAKIKVLKFNWLGISEESEKLSEDQNTQDSHISTVTFGGTLIEAQEILAKRKGARSRKKQRIARSYVVELTVRVLMIRHPRKEEPLEGDDIEFKLRPAVYAEQNKNTVSAQSANSHRDKLVQVHRNYSAQNSFAAIQERPKFPALLDCDEEAPTFDFDTIRAKAMQNLRLANRRMLENSSNNISSRDLPKNREPDAEGLILLPLQEPSSKAQKESERAFSPQHTPIEDSLVAKYPWKRQSEAQSLKINHETGKDTDSVPPTQQFKHQNSTSESSHSLALKTELDSLAATGFIPDTHHPNRRKSSHSNYTLSSSQGSQEEAQNLLPNGVQRDSVEQQTAEIYPAFPTMEGTQLTRQQLQPLPKRPALANASDEVNSTQYFDARRSDRKRNGFDEGDLSNHSDSSRRVNLATRLDNPVHAEDKTPEYQAYTSNIQYPLHHGGKPSASFTSNLEAASRSNEASRKDDVMSAVFLGNSKSPGTLITTSDKSTAGLNPEEKIRVGYVNYLQEVSVRTLEQRDKQDQTAMITEELSMRSRRPRNTDLDDHLSSLKQVTSPKTPLLELSNGIALRNNPKGSQFNADDSSSVSSYKQQLLSSFTNREAAVVHDTPISNQFSYLNSNRSTSRSNATSTAREQSTPRIQFGESFRNPRLMQLQQDQRSTASKWSRGQDSHLDFRNLLGLK